MITESQPKTVRDLRAAYFEVEQWNDRHRDGTYVTWTGLTGAKTQTRTRGAAMLINGIAMVYLLGVHGAKPLREITPCYCRWVKFNRRGSQENPWKFCAAENESELQAYIQKCLSLDASIVSYETSNLQPHGAEAS